MEWVAAGQISYGQPTAEVQLAYAPPGGEVQAPHQARQDLGRPDEGLDLEDLGADMAVQSDQPGVARRQRHRDLPRGNHVQGHTFLGHQPHA